jgi:hypothetical protein
VAELYLFSDNGTYHAFSPTIFSKVLNGITYTPTIIVRSGLSLTDNLAKTSVNFKFDRTNTYAKSLLVDLPEVPITVIIYRNNVAYWRGRVTEVKANSLSIEVVCDSVYSSITRAGLAGRITLGCRHTLYSANCGVIQESYFNNYNVTGLNDKTIPLLTGKAASYYALGIASINGQSRHIVKDTGSVVTLSAPFTGVQSGILALYPGCTLSPTSCKKFNNFDNYGGFPFIPDKNPFSASGAL